MQHSKMIQLRDLLIDSTTIFVLVPINKADDNIAIICQHFYLQMLIKKLEVDNLKNAYRNYKYLPNTNKDTLILSHSKLIRKNQDK